MRFNIQLFGGRGGTSGGGGAGGGAVRSQATTTQAQSGRINAPTYTLDSARRQFDGQTAADVQSEIARIFRSMGSPMNGNPQRSAYNAAVAPLRQLIQETINNGSGTTNADYDTLLRTSIVGGRRRRGG